MTRLHYLQHVPFETPGAILDWAVDRGVAVSGSHLYAGDAPPPPDAYDWLVVMGGPMNVYEYDAHPWLTAEHAQVRAAVGAGRTVLGICLGAQLIAAALGARVRRNDTTEIGWFPIDETGSAGAFSGYLGGGTHVLHWHGDTFDLPDGATHLARSAACAHQAFCVGPRVLGLQYHLELRPQDAARLVQHCGGELVAAPWIQDAQAILSAADHFRAARATLDRLLDLLLATTRART
ncbi:MAG: type 1 glutamine amidotransferase [Gammaproteobacteria bacterium]